MLTIRLQRMGKKKCPTYRFVISEKSRDTQAKSLEILGNYAPTEQPKVLKLNVERIKYWLSVGAQTSNTVHNLLVKEGIIEDKKKKKSVTITNKRKAKLEAKEAEKKEKLKAEAEAKAQKEAEEAEAAKKAEEEKKEAEKKENVEEPKTEEATEEKAEEVKKEDA